MSMQVMHLEHYPSDFEMTRKRFLALSSWLDDAIETHIREIQAQEAETNAAGPQPPNNLLATLLAEDAAVEIDAADVHCFADYIDSVAEHRPRAADPGLSQSARNLAAALRRLATEHDPLLIALI